MTELPTTLTVEALRDIREVVGLWRTCVDIPNVSKITRLVDSLDSWIAELSPMEEPPELESVALVCDSGRKVAYQKGMKYEEPRWFAHNHFATWQQILEYDPHPQIIYTPEESE